MIKVDNIIVKLNYAAVHQFCSKPLEIHELKIIASKFEIIHKSTLVSQLGNSPALAKSSRNAAGQLQLHLQPVEN